MDHIQKAKSGDADAFIALMQSYMQSMYKIARSILKSDEDVADAIQETILSCWEKLEQLKERRYFKTWMIRILINKCNDIWNEKKRYMSEDDLPECPVFDSNYDNAEWDVVLNALDEKYRLIIVLYYVEGFKTSEISKMLSIPESTVRTRLARGRNHLAKLYGIEGRRVSS